MVRSQWRLKWNHEPPVVPVLMRRHFDVSRFQIDGEKCKWLGISGEFCCCGLCFKCWKSRDFRRIRLIRATASCFRHAVCGRENSFRTRISDLVTQGLNHSVGTTSDEAPHWWLFESGPCTVLNSEKRWPVVLVCASTGTAGPVFRTCVRQQMSVSAFVTSQVVWRPSKTSICSEPRGTSETLLTVPWFLPERNGGCRSADNNFNVSFWRRMPDRPSMMPLCRPTWICARCRWSW